MIILSKITRKKKCEKLIKYQDRKLSFGGGIGGSFSFPEFSTSVDVLHSVGETALALDDYLYILCESYRDLPVTDPDYKNYLAKRVRMLDLMTGLRVTLVAFESDPVGQKENLNHAIGAIQELLIFEKITKQEQIFDEAGITETLDVDLHLEKTEDENDE